jgi:glycosyltransferase involved in cell wall biosynthesis
LPFDVLKDIYKRYPTFMFIAIGRVPCVNQILDYYKKHYINNYKTFEKVSFDDLAKFYVAADFYIHSGAEPYSTALQYAAIAGLAIVSSPQVGATWDYVIDGLTGFKISYYLNKAEWFQRISELIIMDRDRRNEFGLNAKKLHWKDKKIYMNRLSIYF